MSESFLIEIWGEPAGYLLEEGSAFRFTLPVEQPRVIVDV